MNKFLTDESSITAWLDKYEITGYKLIPDKKYGFKINVEKEVSLQQKNLNFIPVKFNIVKGGFDCMFNRLTSLEFCPRTIVGNFYCNNNALTSLEFCPQRVSQYFDCANNRIESLEFIPVKLGENHIDISNNPPLGAMQSVTDFNIIVQEHLRLKAIKDLAHHLNDNLAVKQTSHKIKI